MGEEYPWTVGPDDRIQALRDQVAVWRADPRRTRVVRSDLSLNRGPGGGRTGVFVVSWMAEDPKHGGCPGPTSRAVAGAPPRRWAAGMVMSSSQVVREHALVDALQPMLMMRRSASPPAGSSKTGAGSYPNHHQPGILG